MKEAEHDFQFAEEIDKTLEEIEGTGKRNPLTKKVSLSEEEYDDLTTLAKEAVTGREVISDLVRSKEYYEREYFYFKRCYEDLKKSYDDLKEKCRPFLEALEHFPDAVRKFVDTVRDLFAKREADEKAAREKAEADRKKAAEQKRKDALNRRQKNLKCNTWER